MSVAYNMADCVVVMFVGHSFLVVDRGDRWGPPQWITVLGWVDRIHHRYKRRFERARLNNGSRSCIASSSDGPVMQEIQPWYHGHCQRQNENLRQMRGFVRVRVRVKASRMPP